MPIEKFCERCGQGFKVRPRDSSQRFCGLVCKRAHESLHGRANAHVPTVSFTCGVCGKPFEHKPSIVRAYRKKWGKDPMYCSTACGGIGRKLSDAAWQVQCVQCGTNMPIQRRPGGSVNRQKQLCSTDCRSLFRRLAYQKKHASAEPTTRVDKRNGYIKICIPGALGKPAIHTYEHRYVMERKIGRRLTPEETVHHIDGVRSHNDMTNLELFSSRHGPGQRVTDKVTFAIEILSLYPDFARQAGYALHRIGHQVSVETPPSLPG